MSASAQFAATPKIGHARIATANSNRDGTGTVATLFTAGVNGSRVDSVSIKATGATSAGMLRFFVHDGTNLRALTEDEVYDVNPAATDRTHESYIELAGGLALPSGYSLRVSTENAEQFDVMAFGGDF